MKQVWAVFGWILVGALAAILGIGFFFYKANVDRTALAAQSESARQKVEEALASAKSLAEEANAKLAQASKEIAAAEARVKGLEEETRLIAQAKTLTLSATARRWPEYLSLPQGIGLRLPVSAREYENSAKAFLAGPKFTANSGGPWIEIRPHTSTRESELNLRFKDSTQVLYLVNGRLIVGRKGTLNDGAGTAFALRVQTNASSTHLIWGRTGTGMTEMNLQDVFASLTFRP